MRQRRQRRADAVDAARSVARSNLFKCAIYGEDPNWGRIISAVGTTDVGFDPDDRRGRERGLGLPIGGVGEDRELVDMSGREVSVVVDLKAGDGTGIGLDQRSDHGLRA